MSRSSASRVALGLVLAMPWLTSAACRRNELSALPTVTTGGFPRQVRWANGRTITLASSPNRVYLASSTVVDFAVALLTPSRVSGLCAQAHTASILALDGNGWRHLPTHERLVAEQVLALQPDLVLCSEYNDPNSVAALERAGVAVLSLPAANDLDEALAMLRLLGGVLGEEQAAQALTARCEQRREALARAASTPRRRALCFTHNPTGSWTGGRRTMHDQALRLAGLQNAAESLDGHVPITNEQILALDPDVLVLDQPVAGGRSSLQLLRENAMLARLRALVTGQVVELPAALYAAGSHHVLDAAERIVAALPPGAGTNLPPGTGTKR